ASTVDLRPRATLMDDLVDDAVDTVRAAAESRAQRIRVVRDPQPGVTKRVDEDRLRSALEEVLGNAVKFGPHGGTITVVQTIAPHAFTLSVHDDGPGIEPLDQDRVFERFFRSASARESAVQGFGLGLPLARKIVHAHGGRISIHSVPPAGTTVTITLPDPRSGDMSSPRCP
ncbi:MAG: ATP-binding protein, partial [Solirubrobacteraceae bacterium]|nr:ATP-binding protein [Solirubrobacteraceae bacterium]